MLIRRLPPVVPAVAAMVLVLAMAAGVLAAPKPAAAHTELLQASPGPGQRGGGKVEFIDLVFLEPVSEATVQVLFEGESLPGKMNVDEGSIIRFELDDPLETPGSYQVVYQMISYDLDDTEADFSFTFSPDAPQVQRIGDPGAGEQGPNWVAIVATGVLVLSLAGLAFLFLSRLESKRRLAGEGPDDVPGDSSDDGGVSAS